MQNRYVKEDTEETDTRFERENDMAIKVMLVDDEAHIRLILRRVIERNPAFCVVSECDSMTDALLAFHETQPEVVFMDIEIKGSSGIDCAKVIAQSAPDTKIIFATAYSEYMSNAFELYAFDYLVKPFSYMELLSRVKALIRRYKVYQKQEEKEEELVCYRDITIDPDLQTVQAAGEKIALTEMEYQILLLLISHPRKVFSVKEIYELVWKEEFLPNSGNTVMVHIRNIRRKLEKKGESYIQNIWGRGYCVN